MPDWYRQSIVTTWGTELPVIQHTPTLYAGLLLVGLVGTNVSDFFYQNTTIFLYSK